LGSEDRGEALFLWGWVGRELQSCERLNALGAAGQLTVPLRRALGEKKRRKRKWGEELKVVFNVTETLRPPNKS